MILQPLLLLKIKIFLVKTQKDVDIIALGMKWKLKNSILKNGLVRKEYRLNEILLGNYTGKRYGRVAIFLSGNYWLESQQKI